MLFAHLRLWITFLGATLLLGACGRADQQVGSALPAVMPVLTSIPDGTFTPTVFPTILPSSTVIPTIMPTSTPLPPLDPAGCKEPPQDYTRVTIRGHRLNARTMAMLEQAAVLYGGQIDITNLAITQGSYSDNGAASFGTHLGGGAVDISVKKWGEGTIIYDEIEPLIKSLRAAGFAAWLREANEAYPGTAIHIHAIAVGDAELSYPAREQLTGKFGYFRGFNGLPQQNGIPVPDRHGGPILCQWMVAQGYTLLMDTPATESQLFSALTPGARFVYRVEPGDTLLSIAAKFGVSPAFIITQNHLHKVTPLDVKQPLVIFP